MGANCLLYNGTCYLNANQLGQRLPLKALKKAKD